MTNIFISHSHDEKDLAGQIKRNLERTFEFLKVFVAHDDIEPTSEWQEEIIKALKTNDILIMLLSKSFTNSNWTDQETGIAIYLNQKIIPVSIDGTVPYGFAGRYQALKWDKEKFYDGLAKLVLAMCKTGILTPDHAIQNFCGTIDFRAAGPNLQILLELEDDGIIFNKSQLTKIANALNDNYTIRDSFFITNVRHKFYERHPAYKPEPKIVVQVDAPQDTASTEPHSGTEEKDVKGHGSNIHEDNMTKNTNTNKINIAIGDSKAKNATRRRAKGTLITCAFCNGSGKINEGSEIFPRWVVCEVCHGKGKNRA